MSRVEYAVPPEFFPPPPAQSEPRLPPRPPTCLPALARPVWPVDFEAEATTQISRRLDLLVAEVERLSREVQALHKDLDDLHRR